MFSGSGVSSFLFCNMPDAPVYHDPHNVPGSLHFGSHHFFWAPLGILCGLFVLPRFWSTRIFALNLYAARIVVFYTLKFINACIWRNHAHYISIYSDACEDIYVAVHSVICLHQSAAWLELQLLGILRVNSLCVVKFLWICSTPAGMIHVSDQVRLSHLRRL